MKKRLANGRRSTTPSPTSRTARIASLSFEKSLFSPSVAIPIATVSNRRQR
jgi:hypothetical protein